LGTGDPEIFLSFHKLYYSYGFFKFNPDMATRQAEKGPVDSPHGQ